jgi:ketosteroid isomerase-like protein
MRRHQEEAMGTLEQVVLTHYDAVNRADIDAVVAGYTNDCEIITPGGTLRGSAGRRLLAESFITAAPDAKLTALNLFEAGDTVIVEGEYAGTHTGPLTGAGGTIPATGRAFRFPFCELLQIRGGKIASHRVYWDNVLFLGQLGVMPTG